MTKFDELNDKQIDAVAGGAIQRPALELYATQVARPSVTVLAQPSHALSPAAMQLLAKRP